MNTVPYSPEDLADALVDVLSREVTLKAQNAELAKKLARAKINANHYYAQVRNAEGL